MRTFGYTTDDITTGLDGLTPAPGVALYVWDQETGGTSLLNLLSDLDGSFGWSLDTTADGLWVSAGIDGARWYVPAHEALQSKADQATVDAALATKANAATVGALTTRVDTTETRVGTVENEVGGRLGATTLNSTFVPANPALTVNYNPDGTVSSTVENGVTTSFTYNPDGTVATQTRTGVTRTFTYSNGNVTGAA